MISQDHSWPAEQVRLGVIKPEDAATHPLRHRLTRAVGVWEHGGEAGEYRALRVEALTDTDA